jgi:hypothetical protein
MLVVVIVKERFDLANQFPKSLALLIDVPNGWHEPSIELAQS